MSTVSSSGKIAYNSKADAAYRALRQNILRGVLAPGTQLNQAKVAADLSVSATPLREALRRLEAEGFVRMRTHRDVVVSPYDPQEAESLYTIRERLDRLSVRLAAKNHDAAGRSGIEKAMTDLRNKRIDSVDANRAFHRAVYLASGNPVLIEVLDSLWDRSDRFRRFTRGIARQENVIAEHEALAQAIFDRDAERAEMLMSGHIKSAVDVIAEELQHISDTEVPEHRGTPSTSKL